MAGNRRTISPISKEIGQFVKDRRVLRGWSQKGLADRMNEYLAAKVSKVSILRIETGEQELKVSELEALGLVFGIALADLTDPRATTSRELKQLAATLTSARDAYWKAGAVLYDAARGLGDELTRAGEAEYVNAALAVFDHVVRETPHSSAVPWFIQPQVAASARSIAETGVRHPKKLAQLRERAALDEKLIAALERPRVRDEYEELVGPISVLDDQIEAARQRLTDTYDQIEAIDNYAK